MDKEELKKSLKAKLQEKKMSRSSKKVKQDVLDKTLKESGIDKETFIQDYAKILQSQTGNANIDMKKLEAMFKAK